MDSGGAAGGAVPTVVRDAREGRVQAGVQVEAGVAAVAEKEAVLSVAQVAPLRDRENKKREGAEQVWSVFVCRRKKKQEK